MERGWRVAEMGANMVEMAGRSRRKWEGRGDGKEQQEENRNNEERRDQK